MKSLLQNSSREVSQCSLPQDDKPTENLSESESPAFSKPNLMALKWVIQKGCPMGEETCWAAAGSGNLEMLQWLHILLTVHGTGKHVQLQPTIGHHEGLYF